MLMLRRSLCTSRGTAGFVRLGFTPSTIFGVGEPTFLTARVFDTPPGVAFIKSCPHRSIRLSTFGAEVYGPLAVSLPEHKPQPLIPPGGLAFSQQGQFLCVFYGQDPAWPVDYIGQIDDEWEKLRDGSWTELSARHTRGRYDSRLPA